MNVAEGTTSRTINNHHPKDIPSHENVGTVVKSSQKRQARNISQNLLAPSCKESPDIASGNYISNILELMITPLSDNLFDVKTYEKCHGMNSYHSKNECSVASLDLERTRVSSFSHNTDKIFYGS